MTETRNSKVLADFTAYCQAHPSERFWQALRNWADGGNWIIVTDDIGWTHLDPAADTFYWEGRNSEDNHNTKRS